MLKDAVDASSTTRSVTVCITDILLSKSVDQ